MGNPEPTAVSRTEAWLRSHEEWAAPNDDLRSKVIRNACTAQVQANEQAQEKYRSQWILLLCICFCATVTWFLQDAALGLNDPQASALMAAADDGWLRPIEMHAKVLHESGSGFSYDWSLTQAHVTWRAMLYQRFARALCQ
jgi:hypothetical protein